MTTTPLTSCTEAGRSGTESILCPHPPARRPAFHDRHRALGEIHLDTDLITHLLRYPPPAPSLHASNVCLRQTRHATSLPNQAGSTPTRPVATITGIRLTTLTPAYPPCGFTTCVTLLLDLGVPPHIVMRIVGHATLDVTMGIYAHAALEEQRQALRKLEDRLSG